MTVTVLPPSVAPLARVMLAVIVVEFWTELLLTVIPVPLKDNVPLLKLVPVTVKLNVVPCWPVGGATETGIGAPEVTVKAAARVPVCVSALVTITSREVKAAELVIVMLAVIVVAF